MVENDVSPSSSSFESQVLLLDLEKQLLILHSSPKVQDQEGRNPKEVFLPLKVRTSHSGLLILSPLAKIDLLGCRSLLSFYKPTKIRSKMGFFRCWGSMLHRDEPISPSMWPF